LKYKYPYMKRLLLLFLVILPICAWGQIITNFAGGGTGGDGSPAISASIYAPQYMAFDSIGNLFFSQLDNKIRKIDINGIITTIAGNGTQGFGGDNGPATNAIFHQPEGVAIDKNGNIYIADNVNHRIRKVDASNGIITTIAGNSNPSFSGDNGPAIAATLFYPSGLWFDTTGNLFIGDYGNHRVRKIDTSGIITTICGNGSIGIAGNNGPALSARCSPSNGIFVDKNGDVYISEWTYGVVRKVNSLGIITLVAGDTSSHIYNGDGILATNSFLDPIVTVVSDNGIVYISDSYNNRVRRISLSDTISTVAGNGGAGYSGDNGLATLAQIKTPGDLAFDKCGNLYISGANPSRIRKVWFNTDTIPQVSATITPNDTVITGTQITTVATATNHGTITSYQWVKNGANASTNSAYTYTPVNGDSVYCIVTVRACTGRMYTDTTTAIHITVTGGAGVNNITNYTTHTYPNPVTDVLHVATTEPQHYVLHNLMGITLLQGSLDKQNTIDMKAVPTGIYLLQLTDAIGQREVVRVVKE
jgi:sugar lactone lactonase YvrE